MGPMTRPPRRELFLRVEWTEPLQILGQYGAVALNYHSTISLFVMFDVWQITHISLFDVTFSPNPNGITVNVGKLVAAWSGS